MPRYNNSAEGFNTGGCKIRKRGFSSSSTPLLYGSQFKGSVLIRKRDRYPKPVNTSKMNAGSLCTSGRICEASRHQISMFGGRGTRSQASVSARKLANALWEMNGNPPPKSEKLQGKSTKKGKNSSELLRSFEAISLPKHLSDPSHSSISVRSEESRPSNNRRATSVIPKKLQQAGHDKASKFARCSSLTETEFHSQSFIAVSSTIKDRLGNLFNGLSTSKELLQVLHRFCGCAEPNSLGFTIFSTLSSELEQSILNVNQLMREHNSVCHGINYLKDNLAAQLRAWKIKEKERINSEVRSLVKDLNCERKLRRRVERLNRKLAMELARSKEEKAEVEELKRESAKARDDLEKEKKNAAIDRLRNDLEEFLNTENKEKGNENLSEDCDLHSIELNMDSKSRSFNWSYATGSAYYGTTSSEENNVLSEMSKKESWNNGEGDEGRSSRKGSQLVDLSGSNINLNEDVERYISVKELRDQLLAGSRTVLPQGTVQRSKEGLKVAKLVKQLEGDDKRVISATLNS